MPSHVEQNCCPADPQAAPSARWPYKMTDHHKMLQHTSGRPWWKGVRCVNLTKRVKRNEHKTTHAQRQPDVAPLRDQHPWHWEKQPPNRTAPRQPAVAHRDRCILSRDEDIHPICSSCCSSAQRSLGRCCRTSPTVDGSSRGTIWSRCPGPRESASTCDRSRTRSAPSLTVRDRLGLRCPLHH